MCTVSLSHVILNRAGVAGTPGIYMQVTCRSHDLCGWPSGSFMGVIKRHYMSVAEKKPQNLEPSNHEP